MSEISCHKWKTAEGTFFAPSQTSLGQQDPASGASGVTGGFAELRHHRASILFRGRRQVGRFETDAISDMNRNQTRSPKLVAHKGSN